MKITVINGQNHKGSSYMMGQILARKLAADSDITEFFLPRELNGFCHGCYQCLDSQEKCPFREQKKRILDAMEQSELLIFTSPNYSLGPSGPMKSFLDFMFGFWMVHKPLEWMFKKKAVILSTSAGAPCGQVIRVIKSSLSGWGIPQIKSFGTPVHAKSWAGVDEKKRQQIEKRLTAMAKSLDNGKLPAVGLGTRANFEFMRMLHIKGWDSSPTEGEYWKEKGWLGKARPWK